MSPAQSSLSRCSGIDHNSIISPLHLDLSYFRETLVFCISNPTSLSSKQSRVKQRALVLLYLTCKTQSRNSPNWRLPSARKSVHAYTGHRTRAFPILVPTDLVQPVFSPARCLLLQPILHQFLDEDLTEILSGKPY